MEQYVRLPLNLNATRPFFPHSSPLIASHFCSTTLVALVFACLSEHPCRYPAILSISSLRRACSMSLRIARIELDVTVRRICACPRKGLSKSRYRVLTTSSIDANTANNNASISKCHFEVSAAMEGEEATAFAVLTIIPEILPTLWRLLPLLLMLQGRSTSLKPAIGSRLRAEDNTTYETRMYTESESKIVNIAGGTPSPSVLSLCVRSERRDSTCLSASDAAR
mmetsp:Transcript_3767/g.5970  ORF Transcript_3767/g.5970 Transcript_3767/m.5970 type:complete len:224 (+) Transcript_3767:33-704(+)